jgi:hypothetical protein
MVETRRYQWWKPEDTNGGNQKIPMRKPEDTNGGNQKIPMGKPEDTNGGNQKIPMVETRSHQSKD